MSQLTYKDAIRIAPIRQLTIEEFDEIFDTIEISEGEYTANTLKEALILAKTIDPNTPYRHIWSAIDGDNSTCVLNGIHTVNVFGFIVTANPWGDGTDNDDSLYIESEY